jgi:hypothetical protein
VFITAVIGIVSFALAILPGSPYYYQAPMGIIGKVYATSMLVVVNSRMQLGPKETPLRMISVLKFGTAPVNNKSGAIEAHRGDVSVDTDGIRRTPARSQEV